MLFWINTQSDRIVIILSDELSWIPTFDLKSLGAYGTVAALILMPRGTIVKTMQSIIVPGIAATKSTPDLCLKRFRNFLMWTTLLAAAIAFAGSLIGDLVFLFILGDAFEAGASVAPILIAAMGIQLIRTACYCTSTGLGQNSTTLIGNIARLVGLPVAIVVAANGYGLHGLAVSVFAAEAIAVALSGLWLRRLLPSVFLPVMLSLLAITAISAVGILLQRSISSELPRIAIVLVILLAVSLAFLRWRKQVMASG